MISFRTMARGRSEVLRQSDAAEEDFAGRYWLRVGPREVPLEPTETVIGRGDGCHVVVNEAMVSRRHARVVLAGGRPYIEDLGSANGTFVNHARVHGFQDLYPGDRIFVGTCEIELHSGATEERPTMPVLEEDLDRPTPWGGVNAFDASAARRITQREGAAVVMDETDSKSALEEFESSSHLADKMFTMGRVDAALRILSEPLEGIRQMARTGRIPGPVLLDAVGRYAVKLAAETLDGRWIDLAIETHLCAARPLREETIQKLAALRARAAVGDDDLLAQYCERLRGDMESFSPSDRILCERVACLLPV